MLQLFRWFSTLLGKRVAQPTSAPKPENAPMDDFARLNSYVPLRSAADVHHAFVRREAVLNREGKVAGYEFSLLTSLQARTYREDGIARRAYDAALLARLAMNGVESLLGPRLAFINLSAESLGNPLISQLPPEHTVLILTVAEGASQGDRLPDHLIDLKEMGFSIGLRIIGDGALESPFLGQAEFIQISIAGFNGLDLRTLTRHLRKALPGDAPLPQLLACDVQSHDDFDFCHKGGFDLFQGPFVSSRESFRATNARIRPLALLPLLSMAHDDKDFSRIAEQLRKEPTMSYKLLRYLNSAAVGLQKPVNDLTEALVVLGREKFYRWVSLLFFDFANPSYREHLLTERALVRARTLELLAGKGNIPANPNHLFLIGLFSLLDEALACPLPELLEKTALPAVVRDALLGKPGPYADALVLVVRGEADSAVPPEALADALAACAIGDPDFMLAASEAVIWSSQVLMAAE